MFMYAIKIETSNDSSGNPRRGYLVYNDTGNLVGFANENYNGQSTIFNRLSETLATEYGENVTVYLQCILNVPVSEYRTARKHRQL